MCVAVRVRRGPPPILFMLTLFVHAGGMFAQNAANAQEREGRERKTFSVPSSPPSFPVVGGSIKTVRTGRKYVIARPKVALAGRREREEEDKETTETCGERTG